MTADAPEKPLEPDFAAAARYAEAISRCAYLDRDWRERQRDTENLARCFLAAGQRAAPQQGGLVNWQDRYEHMRREATYAAERIAALEAALRAKWCRNNNISVAACVDGTCDCVAAFALRGDAS